MLELYENKISNIATQADIKIIMIESNNEIDRIDRKILSILQEDGRISNLRLSELVGLSPTAVLGRVQRLTRDGYVLGYEARLNPLKLGAGMLVFVEVLLDRTTPNVFEQFNAAVQVRPEIMECHMVAGGFDYLLKTRTADMNALTVSRALFMCASGLCISLSTNAGPAWP